MSVYLNFGSQASESMSVYLTSWTYCQNEMGYSPDVFQRYVIRDFLASDNQIK